MACWVEAALMPGKDGGTQLICYPESSCKTIKLMANHFNNSSVNSRSSVSALPSSRRAIAPLGTLDASSKFFFQKRDRSNPALRCGLRSAAGCSIDGSSGPASRGRPNLFCRRLSVFPQGVCPLVLADSELPAGSGGVFGQLRRSRACWSPRFITSRAAPPADETHSPRASLLWFLRLCPSLCGSALPFVSALLLSLP